MGFFDKLFQKKEEGIESTKKVDVEARFERLRSAVSGTMSNFFVAKDRSVKLGDFGKAIHVSTID